MTFRLRPYQEEIVDFIFNTPRCNVWAGMGMGKTVSTLTAIDALFLTGDIQKKVLVLAPLRVARSVWPDEVKKWSHLRHLKCIPICGSEAQRERALGSNAHILTINYENLPWLRAKLERGPWPFDMVVADESTRLKSFRLGGRVGLRARAIAKFAFKTARWVNLTGTPSPNGVQDLWGQQWFVDKGAALGASFGAFESRWFKKIPTGAGFHKREAFPHAHDEVSELLKPSTITIDPADHFDLGAPIVSTIAVALPPKARTLYARMQREFFMELESGAEVKAVNAAAKSMKLLQLANGAVYSGEGDSWEGVHTAKIDALKSVIEEAGGAPVLVAYHFKSDLERVLKAIPGAVHLDKKASTIAAWNKGKIPVLVAHPASAGHGLNLQDGGNILVFFGHWWSLENHDQILERIGPVRQKQAGYNRPVFVYYITARGTLDAAVIDARVNKRSVQDALMRACKIEASGG